jgi:cell wall-associated NlpC family hydrolase
LLIRASTGYLKQQKKKLGTPYVWGKGPETVKLFKTILQTLHVVTCSSGTTDAFAALNRELMNAGFELHRFNA